MRIAYVLCDDLSCRSGVAQKVFAQMDCWRERGHSARAFCLRGADKTPAGNGAEILSVGAMKGLIHRLTVLSGAAATLRTRLVEYSPDLVYVRFMLYLPRLMRLLRQYPTVLEVNTDDVAEFNRGLRTTFAYNVLTRSRLLKLVRGMTPVTYELQRNRRFAKYGTASRVIPNGVSRDQFRPVKATPSEMRRLVFIGMPGHVWHGLDRLLEFARETPDLTVDIIGPGRKELERQGCGPLPPNVALHGQLSPEQAAPLVQRAAAAVGSLALDRIGLSEACPLKTRQYLALGVPVIVGYNDTDLADADLSFVLNVGQGEDNLQRNRQRVLAFIEQAAGLDRQVVQDFAGRHLAFAIKEDVRLRFFRRVLRSVTPGNHWHFSPTPFRTRTLATSTFSSRRSLRFSPTASMRSAFFRAWRVHSRLSCQRTVVSSATIPGFSGPLLRGLGAWPALAGVQDC